MHSFLIIKPFYYVSLVHIKLFSIFRFSFSQTHFHFVHFAKPLIGLVGCANHLQYFFFFWSHFIYQCHTVPFMLVETTTAKNHSLYFFAFEWQCMYAPHAPVGAIRSICFLSSVEFLFRALWYVQTSTSAKGNTIEYYFSIFIFIFAINFLNDFVFSLGRFDALQLRICNFSVERFMIVYPVLLLVKQNVERSKNG